MSSRSRRFASALLWTGGHQIFEVVAGLAVMLILVRIIPPTEYGRATAAVGVIGFLNLLSARNFLEHALQLNDDTEVDWSKYWGLMWYFQLPLFVVGNVVGVVFSLTETLATVAPLVHIASVGFLIDGMAQLSLTMMRRSLDISRLRAVLTASVAIRLIGTLAGALAGWGAAAIVVGGNILPAVPMALSLFVIEDFRPRWPGHAAIVSARDALHYGGRQTAAGVLGGARSLVEGVLLPATIGLEALGLLNRAQALFSVIIGRLITAFNDTTYPFAARAADDAPRLAKWAGMQLFVAALLAIGGGLYLAAHGADVVAVLYGSKWQDVVPLLVPGVTAAAAGSLVATTASLLLAARRVNASVLLDAANVAFGLGAALFMLEVPSGTLYLWTLAAVGVVVAAVGLRIVAKASPTTPGVIQVMTATTVSSMVAAGASLWSSSWLGDTAAPVRLAVTALVFAAVGSTMLGVMLHEYVRSTTQMLSSMWKVPECNQLQNV